MHVRRTGWHGMNRQATLAHGRRMLASLDATMLGTDAAEVSVVDLLNGYAGELAIDFCLGQGNADVAAAVVRRAAVADRLTGSSLQFPAWLPLPRVRAMVRATAHLNATLTTHVRRRRADPVDQPQDLLDLLLANTTNPLTEDQVVTLVKANLFASYSTPGLALAWIVHEFAARPAAFDRVLAEADALHTATGSVLDDTRLPYTAAFVKEVLRLYPPVWLMQRYAARPTVLGEWDIRRAQYVTFSPYLLHRDPRWWTAPEEFKPERWHHDDAPAHRFAYVPFGAGPRVCLGIQLALYQLVVAAARLAVGYRIEVTSDNVAPTPQPALTPVGLAARFTPRTGVLSH
ncbi:cytochrome P450 [Solihabitans fulvus]|nr:cytochrome P450 [Solihabitans fulvus]